MTHKRQLIISALIIVIVKHWGKQSKTAMCSTGRDSNDSVQKQYVDMNNDNKEKQDPTEERE